MTRFYDRQENDERQELQKAGRRVGDCVLASDCYTRMGDLTSKVGAVSERVTAIETTGKEREAAATRRHQETMESIGQVSNKIGTRSLLANIASAALAAAGICVAIFFGVLAYKQAEGLNIDPINLFHSQQQQEEYTKGVTPPEQSDSNEGDYPWIQKK